MSATKKQYIEAIGRRKTASARVRITEAGRQSVAVNDKELAVYFPTAVLQETALASLKKSGTDTKFAITVRVNGGGVSAQAEAMRHGIARALVSFDRDLRTVVKKEGFLTRDSRSKERKKPGLKKARKASQWSKR